MKNFKIIYVYDTLCSWCYGFEPQMQKIIENFEFEADYRIVSGNMFPPSANMTVKDITLGRDVRSAYKQVSEHSGAKISDKYIDKILNSPDYKLNSELPAKAFSAYRLFEATPLRRLNFVFHMQKRLFEHADDMNDLETYRQIGIYWGLDGDIFLQKMNSQEVLKQTQEDFDLARALQVTGFPQVILQTHDNKYFLVARGYDTAKNVSERIDAVKTENLV